MLVKLNVEVTDVMGLNVKCKGAVCAVDQSADPIAPALGDLPLLAVTGTVPIPSRSS
jgi:hypothetical protein